jgi:tRNA dimethylallyltransferase
MSSNGDSGAVRLRIICGPTAAGKSALALRLALDRRGAILSADSRQIYRGFTAGTAKPTATDLERVPHYGVDLVEPDARFSAGEWARLVPRWMMDAGASGRAPLVVGGTGFYLRSLVHPLFDAPALDAERRAALARFLADLDTESLRRWCLALDPSRAGLGRTQLLRAIETTLLTGTRISALHASRARAPTHAARYLCIDPGPALEEAIRTRVDAMLASGWLDEVRELTRSVAPDAPAWTATGYDAMRDVVEQKRSLADAKETIVIRTRQYAKRQRTWFRHQLPREHTVHLDPLRADAFEHALAWWDGAP